MTSQAPEDCGADAPPPVFTQQGLARTVISPAVNAKRAIIKWSGLHGTPFDRGLLLELEAQIAATRNGNLDRPIALLTGQTEAMDAVFYSLLNSAYDNRGSPFQEQKLNLALRFQSQTRATVQTISELKNPRSVAYVQQANIGNAVQVNNDTAPPPGIPSNPPNELLEQTDGEQLDNSTAMQAIGGDPAMATAEALDRAANGRR